MSTLRTLAVAAALSLSSSVVEAQSPVAALEPVPPLGAAGAARQGESAVRAMPIEQRPNRLGHFYGNNVRRRHHGTLFVNRKQTERPLARYFYIAR